MSKGLFYLISLIGVFLFVGMSKSSHSDEKDNADNWDLVWSDEFNYKGLPDSTKWNYNVGDGCPNVCGWGNNELQFYTEKNSKNARVKDGHLIIEAHKEQMGKKAYSSARLISQGKGEWKYGKVEVKAKLPSGKGTWPAIWMLPSEWIYGGWPKSGEIDIMEHVGYLPDSTFGTVHTEAYNHWKGTHQGDKIFNPAAEHSFHTYSIEWEENKITFFVDDKEYFTFNKTGNQGPDYWPFDQKFYLVMNIAVGGHWGGKHGVDEAIWPQRMEVDYVRVFQKNKKVDSEIKVINSN